jgi:thiol-disulfide isomerase/thioredoxin
MNMEKRLYFSLLAAFMVLWLQAQPYQKVGVDGLMDLLQKDTDTTYVVNFWATWCSPCIKEIPHFEDLHRSSTDDPVQVYLVSLDFPRQAEARLLPFLSRNQVTAPVFLMTNLDYNSWIEQVDPSWSGAIPATLIYQGKQRIFLEKELSKEELENHVKQIAN